MHFDYSMQLNCCPTVATSKAKPILCFVTAKYDASSYMAHIRQTLGSSVRQCFKHGNAFEIHNTTEGSSISIRDLHMFS